MASIRLFGRGKSATVAASGPAVGAALIADVLEGLTSASMSTTWRCRHASGVSIGEGAVDFSARRSRSTVIRGKYTFEYVRSGSTAYRTAVTDEDASAGASARARAAADDDDDADEDLDAEELESEDLEASEDEAEGVDDGDVASEVDEEDEGAEEEEGADVDVDAEDEAEAEFVGGDSVPAARTSAVVSAVVEEPSAWERFSESDACGVHAYAEPAVLAAGVRAAGLVQVREAEEFDGVMLQAYSVTLKPKPGDPNRVLARLARQLRDHGANVVVVTAFVDASQADDDEDEVASLNGDGPESADSEGGTRIVRLRIELPHWTPADDPTADHSVSVDLFELGEPVSVEVPEGAGRRTARSCADLALF